MPNELQREKSPYLLQHADNPVAWRPWGPAALALARRENKPIFLSIGYSTCHWCHVMAHESFEQEEVAALLNRAFVPIKVDREERPDVDAVYMAACVALTGAGGWPLTVLLTPDQKPFWAETYLPRPQLLALLKQIEQAWRDDPGALTAAGETLTDHLRQEGAVRPGAPSRALVEQGVAQLTQRFDRRWGGFGPAPKFPMPHQLLFLLRYAQRTGDGAARQMAERTLEQMYRGGLFDHIGGGFARYSTDETWLVPHFEKMLYDNALLALAYTEAYQQTGREIYRNVACRTIHYVLRELADPAGGFVCGQDADSDGVEGKYYVFTPAEIGQVLGRPAGALWCRRFGVTASGNFEGKSILNLIHTADWEQEPEQIQPLRQRLALYRRGRTRLHRDDKVLTSWNGLMIAALARAGLVLDVPRYLSSAERAAAFLRQNLTDGAGRLLARWREGEAAHPGKIDDYAFLAWGLLELYGATFRVEYLEGACALAGRLLDQFFDREAGGFYPYAEEDEALITRTKEVYDGALPSGNAVAALVLSRLARLTGAGRWQQALERQLGYLAGAIGSYPAGHCMTLLALLETLWPTAELVVCAGAKPPEGLAPFLRARPRPGLTVLVKTADNQARLAALAPFTAPYPVAADGARYYLCRNRACQRPCDSLEQVARQLEP